MKLSILPRFVTSAAFVAAVTCASSASAQPPSAPPPPTAPPPNAPPPAPPAPAQPSAEPTAPGATNGPTTTTQTTVQQETHVESKVHPALQPQVGERKVTTPVLASGIIAAAGLVSGIVFAIDGAAQKSSYNSTPDNHTAIHGERSAFIADVSFGVAALFGLTAIALYFLPDPPADNTAPPSPNAPAASAKKKPWISVQGGALRF